MTSALIAPASVKYGGSLAATVPPPAASTSDALPTVARPSGADELALKWWHPDNPLVAFGAILLVTAGLLAGSSTVRVGRTRASVTVGDTGEK
jgi:hypothetical protein